MICDFDSTLKSQHHMMNAIKHHKALNRGRFKAGLVLRSLLTGLKFNPYTGQSGPQK